MLETERVMLSGMLFIAILFSLQRRYAIRGSSYSVYDYDSTDISR